jgi:alpha/beta superfamily hydrolase
MTVGRAAYGSGFVTNGRGRRLFYAEQHPSGSPATGPVWVICTPLLEEKNVSQGLFVNLARALTTTAGRRVLRFDYEGHGDSDGDTAGLGLEEFADDVVTMVNWLRADGRTEVVLLGCRAGALVATLAASRVNPVRVVAWCPLAGGRDDVQALLRLNLTTQLAVEQGVVRPREALERDLQEGRLVNILGWSMGRPLYRSLQRASFAAAVRQLPCPTDIVDLQSQPAGPGAQLAVEGGLVSYRRVPGRQFWLDSNLVDLRQPALIATALEATGQAVPS